MMLLCLKPMITTCNKHVIYFKITYRKFISTFICVLQQKGGLFNLMTALFERRLFRYLSFNSGQDVSCKKINKYSV